MAKGDVHVVPGDKGRRVEIDGTARAHSSHNTQAGARQAAREIAGRSNVELLVHGRNGRIGERNTYGTDPRRTKG